MKRIAFFLLLCSFAFAEDSTQEAVGSILAIESLAIAQTENPMITQSEGKQMRAMGNEAQTMPQKNYRRNIFTAKAEFSYFQPSDDTFQDIYGGGIDYGFDLSTSVWRSLDVFFGFDYFEKDGHSLGGHNKTNIRIIPLSAGLRYRFMIYSFWDIYLGLGPTYSFLKIQDHSPYVKEHVTKSDWGGVGQIGMNFYPVKYLILSIFCDYFYTKMNFSGNHCNVERHDAYIGGFNAGGAIGITF
jgi:hypothetical protein